MKLGRLSSIVILSAISTLYPSYSMGYANANSNTEIELGVELSGYNYSETIPNKETGDDQWFMTDAGPYVGFAGSFGYYGNLFLKIDTTFKIGSIKYRSGNTGNEDGILDYIVDTRALLGINFCRGEWRITPYTGFGYRYLYDGSYQNGKLTDKGAVGYDREANYLYSPLGIEFRRQLNDCWELGGALEYDIFWRGFQESHLEQPGATIATIVNKQNEGGGFRVSVKALRNLSDGRKLIIEPYFRYWDISISDIAVSLRNTNPLTPIVIEEPDNRTNEFGVKFGISF